MIPCLILPEIRSIENIIIMNLPLVFYIHLTKTLYCLFPMMKSLMVKNRCWKRCPEMIGKSLLIYVYYSAICLPIRVKNYSLWEVNLVKDRNGSMIILLTGIYLNFLIMMEC